MRKPMSLDPRELAVESFPTVAADPPEALPTTMRTFERDCTYPDLCGDTLTTG